MGRKTHHGDTEKDNSPAEPMQQGLLFDVFVIAASLSSSLLCHPDSERSEGGICSFRAYDNGAFLCASVSLW